MGELQERLRKVANGLHFLDAPRKEQGLGLINLCSNAADELDRLEKALGLQMREKRKEAEEARLWFGRAQEWKAELDRLTAENSHLRAKLELTPENVERVIAAVERELAMTGIANCEASSEWIDGFEFAGKRATAAIKALGDE